MKHCMVRLRFCHGIAKGGDCKVHDLYWLDSIAKRSIFVLVVAYDVLGRKEA